MLRGALLLRSAGLSRVGEKLTDPAARAGLGQLRSTLDQLKREAEEAATADTSVNFAKYRDALASKQSKEVVQALEKEFKSVQLPKFVDDSADEVKVAMEKLTATAKDQMEKSKARAKELEDHIAMLEANRTTRDTTMEDALSTYPDIRKEIESELKNEQYLKDTPY